jgi:hypothetical protein
MRARNVFMVGAVVLLVALGGVHVAAGGDEGTFSASLTGFKEIPTLSVPGRGSASVELDRDRRSISYTLSYSGLTGPATAAHIHLGKRWVAGGVIAFLCGGGDAGPCPGTGGEVSGTIGPDDVVGPVDQGIAPGEFAEFVRSLRTENTYVNVHTELYPSGEIRGQIEK